MFITNRARFENRLLRKTFLSDKSVARRSVTRRSLIPALLLSLILPFGLVTAGCNPFAAPIPVADSAEQAFKDGETKKAEARKAEESKDVTVAKEKWNAISAYYGAVANKYPGTENALKATMEQAAALDKGTNNKQGAYTILHAALRKFSSTSFPELRPQLDTQYNDVVKRLDEDNSKTIYYKIMDGLVRILGNDPRYSPVAAIFFVAIGVTLVLWPFRYRQFKGFREMQRYQPQLKKIQERYKSEPQLAMQKQQEFYKEHGINQFAGCLPILLQLPVTIYMYQVVLHYQFHFTQSHFLWINPASGGWGATLPPPFTNLLAHNLGESDLLMLVVYAISMFLSSKLTPTQPTTDPAQLEQQKMMAYTMPLMFFVMMLQWQPAAAFVLYWFLSNVFGLTQQWLIYRTLPAVTPFEAKGSFADLNDNAAPPSPTANGAKSLEANPRLVSPKNRKKK